MKGDMQRALWNCDEAQKSDMFYAKSFHYVCALGNVVVGVPALIVRLIGSLLFSLSGHEMFIKEAKEQGTNALAALTVVVHASIKGALSIATFVFHDTFVAVSNNCCKEEDED